MSGRPGVVLVLATITSALTVPGQTIGVSVFIDHFVSDLSLSRSQISTAYLVGTLAGASLLPTVGRLIDREGVRRAQVVVGALFALALVNMSLVDGLLWLTAGFVGIRLLGQGSLSLIATVTVSLRFTERRGTALGLLATGSSGLMAVAPIALAVAINQLGWRSTWVLAAAVIAVVVVPIGWLGLGSLPSGTARTPASDIADPGHDDTWDRRRAMRTRSFWILAAVSGTAGMMSTALNFHQIDLLGEAGLSSTAAAALFLPQVVGASAAGIVVGALSDRVGTRYLPAGGMALLVLAHLLATIVTPGVMVVAYAVTLGAMAGAVRTATATLLPTWFGTTHLGAIQGALTFFNVGSTAIGPVALALLQQRFGSYPPAVLLLTSVPVAALLFSLTPDRRVLRGAAAAV